MKTVLSIFLAAAMSVTASAQDASGLSVRRLNPSAFEVTCPEWTAVVDFYGDNVFRIFRDDSGGMPRNPQADPPASILVPSARRGACVSAADSAGFISVGTRDVSVRFSKQDGLFSVVDLSRGGVTVLSQEAPLSFGRDGAVLVLSQSPDEYYYGGGVQNGRFSHKGRRINIVNENSWTDGGVSSPAPFYWSTGGYGLLWHTFRPGYYDFGTDSDSTVVLSHEEDYLDIFVMVGSTPQEILAGYYGLTGEPVLLPKFAFYEGHLNAYNRDWWKEDPKGILFEDGRRYKESQKAGSGIKESLNGEKGNYQFSARAVIDRYEAHDMPLGWILPNDGYGAGYGQDSTLEGNVENLRLFGEYARSKGVEVGLWTQSDLHPKEGVEPLLQRDIVREVRDAGVRVLKTDVAWVGWGYSFGLAGIADVAGIMPYYGNDARPFIITLDGWAGTQRYGGVWTGDQTGGEWEYIRFHIPTYIGAGLSGQPNVCSDMDGIFGGRNAVVNIRDFQWKAFTSMQLNMDGWGSNEKYPHALGEPAESINRMYLKLKSMLLPYAYHYSHEAVTGKPFVRAMFLDFPGQYAYGPRSGYQFMSGADFLVAPVWRDARADSLGNDVRDGIFLPEGSRWIDYFTGLAYEGGCVLNGFSAPLWKLPVFVREGAVIPMAAPSNNPSQVDAGERIFAFYPCGESSLDVYDDDGRTLAWKRGEHVVTPVRCRAEGDRVEVKVLASRGGYEGFESVKSTVLLFNVSGEPSKVVARVGGRRVRLERTGTAGEFASGENVVFYDEAPRIDALAGEGACVAGEDGIVGNPVLMVRLAACDVRDNDIEVVVSGYRYCRDASLVRSQGALHAPQADTARCAADPYEVTLAWEPVAGADMYEVMFEDMRYTGIRDCFFGIDGLKPETEYGFRIRAVNASGASDWTDVSLVTGDNPLEFAIGGITAVCSAPEQEGFGTERLFDFAESGDMWHTLYGADALPYSLTLDLGGVAELDRFDYLPRPDGGNGTVLEGGVYVSRDASEWVPAGSFSWERNGDVKSFAFDAGVSARYLRIDVSRGVGGYGSGRELYVFHRPGTFFQLPGDINKDGLRDGNDMVSYMNYAGLRTVDSDFEYVSAGDVNCNGLIDAFDVSNVAVLLDDGVPCGADSLAGTLRLVPSAVSFRAGDEIVLDVVGSGLSDVNAFSFCLPYDPAVMEFVSADACGVRGMENLTRDRLHSDGSKALYPMFVNVGEKPLLEGDGVLCRLVFRALKDGRADAVMRDAFLVGRTLEVIEL